MKNSFKMYPRFVLVFTLINFFSCSNAKNIPKPQQIEPPKNAKFGFAFELSSSEQREIDKEMKAWDPKEGTNIWEHSGLFEGDIMLHKKKTMTKNGLLDMAARWDTATVPYYIDDSFTDEETLNILNAMQEYHNKTCIRFRPYVQSDKNWIEIKQDYSGCWSSVGMKPEGQIVNLGSMKCRRHGTIIHELMHAIGFYHQQSASNRDDFIKIHWDNIKTGRMHNFKKYDESLVTNFDVPYDYQSVMHYSAKAFSKNGEITIEPLQPDEVIGQRLGLSEKDIQKINAMYSDRCNADVVNVVDVYEQTQQENTEVPKPSPDTDYIDTILNWFGDLFS